MAYSLPLVSGPTDLSSQFYVEELNETEWTGNSFLWQLPPGLQFLPQNPFRGESLVIFFLAVQP